MESEKVKEIKKALECIVNANVSKIEINYYGNLHADILTLINELESENESLVEERDLYKEQFNELEPRFFDLRDDNKELKDRIAELEKEKTCVWEEWTDGDHSIWCCSNCKEDFCFMEGDVYENNYGYCPHCGAKITALKELKEDDIDETLKEFLQ